MRCAKTVYIFNISELFGSEIASRMESEWGKHSDYQMRIKKNNDGGSITFEKLFYNGSHGIPSRVERVIYPVVMTQLGFVIPEGLIRREEYKNGKLTKLKGLE